MSYIGNETSPQLLTGQDVDPSYAFGTIPSGAVMAFARQTAPTGWVACDGSAYSKTAALTSALYAAIGNMWGETATTFNVPDLRGYFVRGFGTNSDGSASDTFGTKQQDEFESHTHTHMSRQFGGASWPTGATVLVGGSGPTGATGGTETRPKNIALLYCIKL